MDDLLLWLSAKREGSWSQFRGAIEHLHVEQEDQSPDTDDEEARPASATSDLSIYQHARLALQRLGHVEFFVNDVDQGWRVVPPTLALLADSHGEALLCGARSPVLLDALDKLNDVTVTRSEAPGMPELILVRDASREAVISAARVLRLHIQKNAPTTILSAVPNVRDPTTWFQTQIPQTPGWIVHRFLPSHLRWVEETSTNAEATHFGLFKFVMKHQRFHYLRWHGRSYSVPVQVGKYAIMRRRRRILEYDPGTGMFAVPAICRPPLLIERALVLCSGFLPHFDARSGRVEYPRVPVGVARLAAQLLRQDFR